MRRTLKMRMWLLVFLFISPILLHLLPWLHIETEIAAYSAEKNEVRLNTTEDTIGIHTLMSTYVYDFIDNRNLDADYSCKSSNKKIVSITDKVQLRGVSKGTATITMSVVL
ncbi:MAG: hypothetical protein PHH37_15945 [Paludibacter sp.]|nr:hypothetical protein [Paludibacter sp.]